MVTGMGLACCLWGNASLAQSEIDADPQLSTSPIALTPSSNDPRHLIDFTALGAPDTGEQQTRSAHPGADPVNSLQAIATRWLKAITANRPPSQARQSERPVILEPGYRANQAWPAVGFQSSTLAKLESWFGFAPGQMWPDKTPIERDRPFLQAAITDGTLRGGTASASGQVDLIVFDVALTPDGQALRLKGDQPPTIISASLGGSGGSVGASSAAAWVQGLGPDAHIAPSAWRPPASATPQGRRTAADMTASLADWRPAGERLIVLQGLTPEDGAFLRDFTLQSGSPSALGAEPFGTNNGNQARQAAVVFDDGWLFANRITLPVGRLDLSGPADDTDGGRIAFIPFIDTGRGWNTQIPAALDIYDPWSIGVGIGWQMTNQTGIRLGVDTPLTGPDLPESTDNGDFGLQLRLATELGN